MANCPKGQNCLRKHTFHSNNKLTLFIREHIVRIDVPLSLLNRKKSLSEDNKKSLSEDNKPLPITINRLQNSTRNKPTLFIKENSVKIDIPPPHVRRQ